MYKPLANAGGGGMEKRMSNRGKTLLKGHTLVEEGWAQHMTDDGAWHIPFGGLGVGVCSCGAYSSVYPTDAARKRWHREHKEALLADLKKGMKL